MPSAALVDDAAARAAARAVVCSDLLKAAVHGADPNWGRIAMAVGNAIVAPRRGPRGGRARGRRRPAHGPASRSSSTPSACSIDIEGVPVFAGVPLDFDEAALSERMRGGEVLIRVDLGIGDGSGEAFGCDLTEQYVIENSEYST